MDDLLENYVNQGSPEAFRTIVARHGPGVRAHALAVLCDAHSADDVTQAVFIMLARKAHKLRPGVVLVGWLHGATRLACKAHIRAATRRRKHERNAAELRPEIQPLPHDAPQLLELRESVHKALTQLSAADRDALLLRHEAGMDTRDIAIHLGVSEEAAKKRLTRAGQHLRPALARCMGMLGAAPVTVTPELLGTLLRSAPPGPAASSALTTGGITWVDQVTANALSPVESSTANLVAKGAASLMDQKALIAVAVPSLLAVAVTGSVFAYFSSITVEPVQPPPVQLAIATAPPATTPPPTTAPAATRSISTPGDLFQRLNDAITAGNDKDVIDCFVVGSANPDDLVPVGMARLSAADIRLAAAWTKAFPGSTAPSAMNPRLDQAMAPLVPLMKLMGPRMMPATGNEISLRLRDSGIQLPAMNPAQQWMDVPIRFIRGKDGKWRFGADNMITLRADRVSPLPSGAPALDDNTTLTRRFFIETISAIDSVTRDIGSGEINSGDEARAQYELRTQTPRTLLGIIRVHIEPP